MASEKIHVLNITTTFGKNYVCRTADELATFYKNYKKEKNLKRDEDVDIRIGFRTMSKAEFDRQPACKYLIKTK